MKKRLNLILIVVVFSFFADIVTAQDISRPLFAIDNATTDQICVTPSEPNREAVATANIFFPENTEFILELSDEDGNFPLDADDVRRLTSFVSSLEITATEQINFPSFPIPEDLRSDNYRIRVRYVQPDSNSNIGSARVVAIHFFDNSERVTLLGPNPNTNVVALCEGQSVTLTVTPETLGEYQWFFNGVLIADETGTSLEDIDQSGTYSVRSNFGSCNDRFNDNESTVTVIDFNKTTVTINGPSLQEFCPSDIKILTCSIVASGLGYRWFKDEVELVGENNPTLILPESNFEGSYTVEVTGTSTCFEISNPVQIDNLGPDIISRPPQNLILLPSESSVTLEIEAIAPSGSTVEWFINDISQDPATLLSNDGALTFVATGPAEYRAEIITGSEDTNDLCVEQIITNVQRASSITAQIASILDCDDSSSSTLALENLFGVNSSGDEIPLTTDQYAFFDFEWFRNGDSTGQTLITISVGEEDLGQTYFLVATFQDATFSPAISNELVVESLSSSIQIEVDPPVLSEGETVTLTAPQSNNYMYQWFLNGEQIVGENLNTLEVSAEGDYFVRITLLDCTIDSETVTLSFTGPPGVIEIIPNVITQGLSATSDNWILPDSFSESEVEVTIYSSNGKLDFQKSGGYNSDWPTNSASGARELIYYYIITRNSEVVRKGTITVMR